MLAHVIDAPAEEVARWQAEDLQVRSNGWFVVTYSGHLRCYFAYYRGACGEGGLTLRAPDPDLLWKLMERVAPPDWQADDLPLLTSTRPCAPDDARDLFSASAGGRER
jgi:hypothetical protein